MYFFGYKTVFYSFQNNPKNLSRSLELFKKGKTCIITKFHRTDLHVVICTHSREGKIPSYSRINTVVQTFITLLLKEQSVGAHTVYLVMPVLLHRFYRR